MNNNPLMLSILLGIILLLIIGGISLTVKLSNETKDNSACLAERMELLKSRQQIEEEKDSLVKSNLDLKKTVEEYQSQIDVLTREKEELVLKLEGGDMKQGPQEEQQSDELIRKK